jgi:hypothetical protein
VEVESETLDTYTERQAQPPPKTLEQRAFEARNPTRRKRR